MRNCWKSPIEPWTCSMFYGQDLKVVCFSELHHVSCPTLLALTDTKRHTLGRGPSWLIRHAFYLHTGFKRSPIKWSKGSEEKWRHYQRSETFPTSRGKINYFHSVQEKPKQSRCFPFKKQHTLLLIGVDRHHHWHSFLLLQKEGFSCYLKIILMLIFSSFNSCQLPWGYFYRSAGLGEQR